MLYFIRPVPTHPERRVVVLPRSTGVDVVKSQMVVAFTGQPSAVVARTDGAGVVCSIEPTPSHNVTPNAVNKPPRALYGTERSIHSASIIN